MVLEGRSLTKPLEYLQAEARLSPTMESILSALQRDKLDALITPATISTAVDISSTGDPAFNSPWSYTGLPTVSFPTGVATDGLPVAIQLIGYLSLDRELLGDAEWCERAIRGRRQ